MPATATKPRRTRKNANGTPDVGHLTGAALSRMLGVHKTTVSKWSQAGCPRNTDGSYSLAQVFQWNIDRASANKTVDSDTELARWRAARADREELLVGQLRGTLCDRDSVTRVISRHINDAKTLFETTPEAIAQLIPEPKLRKIFREESERIIHDATRTLARSLQVLDEQETTNAKTNGHV